MNRTTRAFDPVRVGRLALSDLYLSYKAMIIALGAAIGVLLVVNVASVFTSGAWAFNAVFFPQVLLIGGFVVTSLSFRNMHNKLTGHTYLTMPGSMLEKYVAKLLLTTLGWSIACLAGYFTFSLLAAGLTRAIFGVSHGVFNPFGASAWAAIRIYVITQSVVFVGAIYFRKLHLLKTALSLTIFGLGVALFVTLLGLALYWGPIKEMVVEGMSGRLMGVDLAPGEGARIERFFVAVADVSSLFFWWLMAPVCWALGYVRLRETQI